MSNLVEIIYGKFNSINRFLRNDWANSSVSIPPGHRILISKFIHSIQSEKKVSKGKSLHKVPRFPAKKSPSSSAVSLLPSSDDNHKNVQINVHKDETDDLYDTIGANQ